MTATDLFDVTDKSTYTRWIALLADNAEVWKSVVGKASHKEQRAMRAALTMWDLCGRPELGDHDSPDKANSHSGAFIYETIVKACNVFYGNE